LLRAGPFDQQSLLFVENIRIWDIHAGIFGMVQEINGKSGESDRLGAGDAEATQAVE
jgi:hypothetical protein